MNSYKIKVKVSENNGKKRDPKTVELAKTILENYHSENVDDMQEVHKDIF